MYYLIFIDACTYMYIHMCVGMSGSWTVKTGSTKIYIFQQHLDAVLLAANNTTGARLVYHA